MRLNFKPKTIKTIYNKVYMLVICGFTFFTVTISISWVTTPVTTTSLFVTQIIMYTMKTAVFGTVISICSIVTLCYRYKYKKYYLNKYMNKKNKT